MFVVEHGGILCINTTLLYQSMLDGYYMELHHTADFDGLLCAHQGFVITDYLFFAYLAMTPKW